MSSDGHHEHAPGANEPREISSPLLWTIGLLVSVGALAFIFFHFKQVGREHAKGEPLWALPTAKAGPDHQALIKDRSQTVLDHGQVVYSKNCASCHGANGDSNPANNPVVPRNFHTERFKSKWGSGPYGFYMVLTDGYNTMPPFRNLSPEDRYAVSHFVREAWMKPNAEQTGYAENDHDTIAKQIPAAGAAGEGAEKEIDPLAVKLPKTTWPLMAAVANAESGERARIDRWLTDAAAIDVRDLHLSRALQRLRTLQAGGQYARLARLHAAAKAQDRAAFVAVLTAEDGAGSADPYFSLLPADTLQTLYARLAETATRTN